MCMKESKWSATHIRAVSLLLLIGALTNNAFAAPGDLDLSFDPGSGVNDEVFAVAVQPDGKVIIGGQFTTVKGLVRRGIARLNANGSGDSSFDPGTGAYGNVKALALQSDGKVLIGGSFSAVNGTNRTGIARLNANGSLDASFNPQLSVVAYSETSPITSLALQSDGKVLIGGSFSAVNGTNRNGIARLNADGSLDGSFNPQVGHDVLALAVQADGKVLIGGVHIICEPDPDTGQCNYIYLYVLERLNTNGNRDTNFICSVNGPVNSIAPQPDGKILIGGGFYQVNGTSRKGIARLNANGSLDGGFNPGSTPYDPVYSVALQPDGKVLIGTDVNNGINGFGIARLKANGTLDNTFDPGTVPNSSVYSVTLQPDGKVIIGGAFTTMNGSICHRVARLDSNGSLDGSFNAGTGVNDSVLSVAAQPDGKALIGGQFTTVQEFNRPGIARLHADGSADSTFDAGLTADARFWKPIVKSVVVQSDGKLLIGGQFSNVHGASRNSIARLHANGSLDGIFNPGTGISGSDYPVVNSIAVQSDGRVLIGGSFTNVNGTNRNVIARLNANGSLDSSFNPDIGYHFSELDYNQVCAIAVQPDGKILVGGYATHFVIDPDCPYYPNCWDSIYTAHFVIRLHSNGTRDTGFEETAGAGPANTFVYAVAAQPDGKILVGGYFATFKGANRNGLARLNADGSLDSSFNPGAGGGAHVDSIVLQPDGRILIGGHFSTATGAVRNGIARLSADGSLDGSFTPGTAADHLVASLALQPDGNVLLGGHFTAVNGAVRPYIARLYGDSPAPSLSIVRSNSSAVLSWPVAFGNFQLQENTNLSLANGWSAVAAPRSTNNNSISVALPATGSRKFFRLSSP
jgi:uncharacterized delta-60 repeat protein